MTPPPDSAELRRILIELARDAGFDGAGIAPLAPSEHGDFLDDWLAAGHNGSMGYLARPDTVARRRDPVRNLPERDALPGPVPGAPHAPHSACALVVAHGYFAEDPPGVPDDPSRGVIARYARGRDYHRVVAGGLRRVVRGLGEAVGTPFRWKVAVDTAPVLERELARRAGLGWFGRNTMLIHPRTGSYFFLGALLLDLPVAADAPFDRDHCGSCRACLDACPTGALLGRNAAGAPVMDARLCISYLTIEHRGPIRQELRPAIGNRVYGCDICQEVCPFNDRFARPATEPGYAARGPGERPVGVERVSAETSTPDGTLREGAGAPRAGITAPTHRGAEASTHPGTAGPEHLGAEASTHPGTDAPSLVALLEMALDPEAWESFSRGSAIRRAGRAGFARNVCVSLGNWLASVEEPPAEALEVFAAALSDPDPLVRGHAAWALGRAGGAAAARLLASAADSETDTWVRHEVEAARAGLRSGG